jgi:hypothetical protein
MVSVEQHDGACCSEYTGSAGPCTEFIRPSDTHREVDLDHMIPFQSLGLAISGGAVPEFFGALRKF